ICARSDAEGARAAIRRLVARIDDVFDPQLLWPAHEWDGWQAATPMKNVYVGAGGGVGALHLVRDGGGGGEPCLALPGAARAPLAQCRREPDFLRDAELPDAKESALLTGETGILL